MEYLEKLSSAVGDVKGTNKHSCLQTWNGTFETHVEPDSV